MIYHYRYVCDPSYIFISAESIPRKSKGIKIKFFLQNKEAFKVLQNLNTYTPAREDIDAHVAKYCSFLRDCTENYIQYKFDENSIMGALNAHRLLKKVRTLHGKVIWIR